MVLILSRIGAVLWLAIIFIILELPGETLPKESWIPHQDKVAHLGLFGGYAFLWLKGFVKNALINRRLSAFLIIAFGVAVGIFTEVLQQRIPGRSGDIYDFIADMIGLSLGIIFYILTEKRNHSVQN